MLDVSSSQLLDQLKSAGLLSADQLQIGFIEATRAEEPIEQSLVRLGFLTETVLVEIKRDLSGTHRIDLESITPDPYALQQISAEAARRYPLFPVSLDDQTLLVAVTELPNLPAQDRIRLIVDPGIKLQWTLAGEREIAEAIDRFYGYELSIDGVLTEIESGQSTAQSTNDSSTVDGDYQHPVVRLVDALLVDAVKNRSSDIHFEPESAFVRVRYRVDGVMRHVRSFHLQYWAAIAVRIKVLAELDIAETRAPQDGQLSMTVSGGSIEFRVSCMPTIHGENIVLRVLDRQKGITSLETLVLKEPMRDALLQCVAKPEGLILITGPTGSGKTTTLYSMLNHKCDEKINIMTLEDPVEYPMPLLRQTTVNDQVKLDFSSGIKSILRQDPDVILVGEIRDAEVSEMVFRAAMTGHQVYSTLHANSAIGAIDRLVDLGATAQVLANNIIAIVAQRLVRKLCAHCRVEATDDLLDGRIYRAEGCELCQWQGYNGRIAVIELLPFSSEFSELVASGASVSAMRACSKDAGFSTLADEGLMLVQQGVTSMTELSRVIEITK